ncbi:MAG: HEPN domain-containing protein [Clostridia bacterium]|nr:HEPN domain-containing protein [Clostridia bacterium]
MNAQDKYKHWLDLAQYDLETANAMVSGGRWLYVVFMCQQAIEKLVKGLYGLYLGFDHVPHTHNITRLINDFLNELPCPISHEVLDFFDLLTRYYLNNRYPDYVSELNDWTQENNAREIYGKTKEVFTWLLTLTP